MEVIQSRKDFYSLKEPIEMGFFSFDTKISCIKIPDIIPKTATWVEITTIFNSNDETNSDVKTRMHTINKDGKYYFNLNFAFSKP